VLVVVLQPELRRLFSRLGGVGPGLDSGIIGTEATISSLVEAAVALSTKRIGGLIVLESGDRLDRWTDAREWFGVFVAEPT
jgi:DNA integrity scanning protein DisA with diadenylate cyclase activity